MVRLAITISVFALLACGGSDTAQTGDAGDLPPVEAAAAEQADVPAATIAPEAAGEGTDEEAASQLDETTGGTGS